MTYIFWGIQKQSKVKLCFKNSKFTNSGGTASGCSNFIINAQKIAIRNHVLGLNFHSLARKIDVININATNLSKKNNLSINIEKIGYELRMVLEKMKSLSNITLVGEIEDACHNNPLFQKLRCGKGHAKDYVTPESNENKESTEKDKLIQLIFSKESG